MRRRTYDGILQQIVAGVERLDIAFAVGAQRVLRATRQNGARQEVSAMNTMPSLATVAPTVSYETTRFNALRHGVLSRYTVLPWEDEAEYQALLDALVAEHAPQGPTEEHLVEELAGIIWRKRRLRLAESAIYREELRRDADWLPRRRSNLRARRFCP